jgi:CheY-like chemotaxis protein
MKPSVVNINAVVDDAVQMIRPALAENIAFEMALDPLVSPALADPGQLTQVLLNLALNARDAMPHGGTLTIETGNITLRDGSGDALSSALPAGDYVRLVVRDTGIGMSPTTLARAFEPFFTTKPPGTGTGLGLATAYGIIKQSLGDIRAESTPGRGSSFTVLIPAARTAAEVTAAQAELPAAPLGDGEHVLLVEDDDGVRDFAREVLKRAGYTVHEARDGAEGLDVAKPILGDIAFVVTDIIMPRMGGRDMVTRLRLQRPDLRVLYMTGYTDDSGLIGELRGSDAELLEKPFGASALVRAAARAAKATPA